MGRELTEAIVDGILGGSVYALMAVGLTLIFGVLDIINIAQGILVVLGAYLSYVLSVHLHIDLFVGLLITVPAMFVMGVAIQWLFIRPLRGRARASMSLLATYAVALIIEGLLYRIFGPNYVVLNASYVTSSVHLFGFYLPDIYLYGFALAVACVAALYLLLYRTRFGRSVRATMQDQMAARLIGIDVNRVAAGGFGDGGGGPPRWRHDVRRHERRLQPEQRLRPDLPAARDHHPRRPRQHRRGAGRRRLHDHGRGAGRHMVAGLGGGGVLRGPGAGAGDPPIRPVRAGPGEGTVSARAAGNA